MVKNLLLNLGIIIGLSSFSQTVPTQIDSCVSGNDTLKISQYIFNGTCPNQCSGRGEVYVNYLNNSSDETINWMFENSSIGTGNDLDSLCPGDYEVLISEVNSGISCSIEFQIEQIQSIAVSISATNETVQGLCDGSAEATITGGVPEYFTTWYDVDTLLIQTGDFSIDSLCDGDYFMGLLDSRFCYAEPDTCFDTTYVNLAMVIDTALCPNPEAPPTLYPFTIEGGNPPPPMSISNLYTMDPWCYGECTGQANFTIEGGLPPYSVSSSGTVYQNTTGEIGFYGLCGGSVFYTVTDSQGESLQGNFDLYEPFELWITTLTNQNETCSGLNDGQIEVTATGGPVSFFTLNNDPNSNIYGSTAIFENLAPGGHEITITDQNGCMAYQGIFIQPGEEINISSLTSTNGNINILADNAIDLGITYSVNNQTNSTGEFVNLNNGLYTVCATSLAGCSICDTVTVENTACALTAFSPLKVQPFCDNSCGGRITVTASNYSEGVDFSWTDNVSQGNVAQNLCAGTYDCIVRDSLGCQDTVTVTLTNQYELTADINIVDSDDNNNNGFATIDASSGEAPYSVSIDNGATWTESDSVQNLAPGEYELCVRDLNQCEYCETVTIGSSNSIQSLGGNSWKLYPNPSNGSVTITYPNILSGRILSIYNMVGKKIYDTTLSNGTTQIETNTYANGMYFAHIISEGKTYVKSFVVMK